jgi:hypothetical protein
MATQPLAGFRVVTEVHVMLLRCQEQAPDRVDALSARLRPAWADLLRACSEWAAESDPDDLTRAVDIATHLSRVVAGMGDDTGGPGGAVVERCTSWHRELLSAAEATGEGTG